VFGRILYRTILLELFRVFLLSLLGITGILLMAGLVSEASQHGLAPSQLLAVIPLIIPSTLPYTIPATTLFATCAVYGRLAHDNEILAMKAAGINVLRVVWPGVFLGLVMSCVTAVLYFHIIPYTHHLMRTMFLNDVEDLLYGMLKRDRCIMHPRLNYVMWVRQVHGRKLQDALFKRRDAKGHYDLIAVANEAELLVDMKNQKILVNMHECTAFSENGTHRGYFTDKMWPVDLPPDFVFQRKQRASDQTWEELFEAREELYEAREKLEAEIALHTARLSLNQNPSDLPLHVKNLIAVRHQKSQEIRGIDVEIQMRPALALGCLCFVLVGCPVGIWFSRSDFLSAFITCFLPIVFLYYPLLLCGINLAKSGRVAPAVSLWIADGIMAVIAVGMYRRLLRN
jgi:lipopolysaccharide export system permease protein